MGLLYSFSQGSATIIIVLRMLFSVVVDTAVF